MATKVAKTPKRVMFAGLMTDIINYSYSNITVYVLVLCRVSD